CRNGLVGSRQKFYGAWIIPPAGKGDVKVFNLGDPDTLDAVALGLRDLIQKSPVNIAAKGEAAAAKDLDKLLAVAARRILQPLMEELKRYPKWVICPDGDLWLLPWAALPVAEKVPLIEKHVLSFVVSGRDLVVKRPDLETSAPIVLAGPDYDAVVAKVAE